MRKIFLPLSFFILFLGSCSSAPKRPVEVFNIQSMVETNLTVANREADRGNFSGALVILNETWRLAVSVDRPELRIRVMLAQANCRHAMGQSVEAEDLWRNAEREANSAGEQILSSVSRIYRTRSMVLAGTMNPEEALALVINEQGRLGGDRLFSALAWTVRGIVEKELGRYAEAERSVMNALGIHERDRYLELAAYDWYLIASIRSVSGRYRDAIEALNNALHFDRRAENSFGLAMTWAAMGEVYRNMGSDELAIYAWHRSAEIFRALDLQAHVRDVESRMRF